jgi:cation-transporting ATPase I
MAGAVANTAAQRWMSLLTETVSRWCLLREAQTERDGWRRWDAKFPDRPEVHGCAALEVGSRPGSFPAGPVEKITGASVTAGPAAFATALGLGRNFQRAQGLLVAGVPRAASVGREAFAAQLGHTLARQGALVVRPRVLRKLDRIDRIVIDASLLRTGRQVVSEVVPVNGEGDLGVFWDQAHALVEAVPPTDFSRDRWTLSTWDGTAGTDTRLLTRDTRPMAWVEVREEWDPLAEDLLRAAREAGSVVLAGGDAEWADHFGVEHAPDLIGAVRESQANGHGVAVVSASDRVALAAADVGIGLFGDDPLPWSAGVITGSGLGQTCLLLRWIPLARTVSQRSASLAAIGSSAGGALALLGPAANSQARAALPVSTCALLALAAGMWQGMQAGNRPLPRAIRRVPWHSMSPARVLESLGSSRQGLTVDAARRRHVDQREDTALDQKGLVRAFLDELASPLTPALVAGAGISASIGAVADAVIIMTVLSVNALIGAVQRVSADRAVRALMRTSTTPVLVRRAGTVLRIPPGDLVPGDVLELVAGDTIPADARLLEADGLEVDESSLTGESQLVSKTVAATPGSAVADRRCMVYQGTAIAAGQAQAVVVVTGADTEAACVDESITVKRPSGVQERLRTLVKVAVPISVGAGVLALGADLLRGQPAANSLSRAVSVAVAAVPEGLPFVSTVAELAAARRLSALGALVQDASTIEALGRADVLCFDKTGTLTEGHIALRAVGDGLTTRTLDELSSRDREVLAAALRASPAAEGDEQLPHPTDRAVVGGARDLGVCPGDGAAGWELVEELPFEPSRGFHAVLGRTEDGHLLSVKGAPEIVLAECTRWCPDGVVDVPWDSSAEARVTKEFEWLACQGYRVLAVAERPATGRRDLDADRVRDLRLVGLIALADPVRPTAADAVNRLQRSGVRVVMITGDHPSTAEAIAAELGILNGHQIRTGTNLDNLTDDALIEQVDDIAIFARTTPAHKARIVRALQSRGRVVAVTGDGANDAPAIRSADVGIALGRNATPAARDAADVVVTDERIETIVDTIVEGRGMWSSVRDALALLLGGNLGEIGFTVVSGLISPGGSLNTRQMLLVNLFTDVLPAMAIAVRPPPDVTPEQLLAEGPEASLGAALTRDILQRGVITGAAAFAAWLLSRRAGTRGHTDTVALVALVGAQLGQTLVVRGRTPLVVISSVASMAALAVVVQTPGISHFFGCTPLWPHGLAVAIWCAVAASLAALFLQWRSHRLLASAGQDSDDLVIAGLAGKLEETPVVIRTDSGDLRSAPEMALPEAR